MFFFSFNRFLPQVLRIKPGTDSEKQHEELIDVFLQRFFWMVMNMWNFHSKMKIALLKPPNVYKITYIGKMRSYILISLCPYSTSLYKLFNAFIPVFIEKQSWTVK